MDNKVYEQCNHYWVDKEVRKEFVSESGGVLTAKYNHYKLVYLQRCEKCNKLNKTG